MRVHPRPIHHDAEFENVLFFGRSSLIAATTVATVAANAMAQAPAATPNPLVTTGDSLMQAHAYAPAAQVFERLTQQHPEQLALWARLGIARHLGHENDGAMAAYRKAIQLGAGPVVKYNMGALFALRGMPDSAFYWLGEAVKVGFTNEQQLAGDEELTSLRQDSRYAALVDRVHKASAPCMYRPESRMFDFWIGDWDVTNVQGQPAGKSSVQLLLEGCALYENWSTPNGGGKSLNSYNPDLKMWQQFWTAQTGQVTEYRTSEWVNGSLRYTARQLTPAPSLLRMTFTPINKDLVRQMGELSTDDGKTWSVAYDLYYHRRK
jgi:hypothetical protein